MAFLRKIEEFFKSKWFKIFVCLLLPFFIIIMVESMSRQSIIEAVKFIKWGHISFWTTYVIISFVTMLFAGVCGKVYWGFFGSILLFCIMGIIDYYKLYILGEHFYPWDLVFFGEIGNLFNFANISFSFVWLLPLALLGGFFFLIYKYYKNEKLSNRVRIIFSVISIVTLCLLCVTNKWYKKFTLSTFNFDANIYIPADFYEKYGLIFSFGVNLSEIGLQIPKGYSVQYAKILSENYNNKSQNIEQMQPNVVILLSEAFTIPANTFKNVTYLQNPNQFFEDIKSESIYGTAITPAFGGGTSNVELEVLSGFLNKFLRKGINAYTQYVKTPIKTIPALLKEQGYSTMAVHTYNKEFFRRHIVYPLMGIDEYIALEDITEPRKKGEYIADDQFVDLLIQNYEKNKSEKQAPAFMLGVSMQNHAPYNSDKYSSYDVDIYTDLLDESEKGTLKSYVQGVYDADKSIEKIVNYFKTKDEPTIILVFGDHLPALDSGFNIYKKLGMVDSNKVDEWTKEQSKMMYSVPYFIWANYGLEAQELPVMDTNYLGNYVLNLINFNKTPYFNYLDKVFEKIKSNRENFAIDENGELLEELPEQYAELERNQSVLQYYYLFDE